MNVRVWAVSSVKLHVEWDPPQLDDHELTITDYVVQYNEVGDNTTITRSLGAQSDTDRHEYDIVNLKPYTYYIIIVHATNDAGNSPGSIPHTVRTLSDGELCFISILLYTYLLSISLPRVKVIHKILSFNKNV